MSIAFESEEVQLQKLRERLRQMLDDEPIKFGKDVRKLSEPVEMRASIPTSPQRISREMCAGTANLH